VSRKTYKVLLSEGSMKSGPSYASASLFGRRRPHFVTPAKAGA